MKSTIEVLDEITGYECSLDGTCVEWFDAICAHRDGELTDFVLKKIVTKAMITYAQQAIDEDRKIVAENAKIQYERDDRHPSHWFEFIDKDSIINAPKLELK